MESRRRAEPSPPAFSTPITLHNHGPGSRATQRPRCFRPALEPLETGTGWAGTGAHERRRRPGSGHEPAAPLPWPPGTTAALWKVLSGIDESKGPISQRLAVALEQPTLHNYGPSIRPVMEDLPLWSVCYGKALTADSSSI